MEPEGGAGSWDRDDETERAQEGNKETLRSLKVCRVPRVSVCFSIRSLVFGALGEFVRRREDASLPPISYKQVRVDTIRYIHQ